ncbi:MAG: Stringent starvation protein B [Rhizobiales bacterium PAR1]|nr:MAG: Stringent starvation protein B [Rhizobiales bacterium PAR1]
MTNEPTEDLIRYDVMVQEALLGVVRKVLTDAAKVGLPGEHHFYITFRSQAPGVKLSHRLTEKYPDEMNIVLQHQFWDLTVGEQSFEVGLSFGGVAERLVVPYEALTGFYDPSVQFGLKFTPDEAEADNDLGVEDEAPTVKDQLEAITKLEKSGKSKKSKADAKSDAKSTEQDAGEPAAAKKSRTKATAEEAAPEAEKPAGGAEVVSLEAFRKKK